MAKTKTTFVCQACGAEFPKWQGRCFECRTWNSLVETVVSTRSNSKVTENLPERLDEVETKAVSRFSSGFSEFDRVLGEGLVPGSVILLGGEPGIGKSTLLLQIAARVGGRGQATGDSKKSAACGLTPTPCGLTPAALYISGEESVGQLKLRADRLGLDSKKILGLAETDVDVVIKIVKSLNPPARRLEPSGDWRAGREIVKKKTEKTIKQLNNLPRRQAGLSVKLVIIDSIQTLRTDDLISAAGSISQVQECSRRLIKIAKETNLSIILVGHVTKDGAIAGPKALTHLVDTVLYLEGERFSGLRILRGVKNRFGQTSEIGIFAMTNKGMSEIPNPAQEVLGNRRGGVPGSVLTVTMEGLRPLLLEVQALTSRAPFGMSRRTVNGIDYKRLLMLLAVLQKRAGLSFANQDVYVNVSGGFKSFEPAIDLAICLALASSLKNSPVQKKVVAIGEVGLLGEVKKPPQFAQRVKEAKRLGFTKVIGASDVVTVKDALAAVL